MPRTSILYVSGFSLAWCVCALALGVEPPVVDFGRQIQPILAKRCYSCHGPDKSKGGLRLSGREAALAELESGEHAIVPGKVEQSALITRISSTEEGERMPPEGKPLSASEIELFRRWIAAGAKWEEHWAFRPPQPQQPPQVKNKGWVRNPIDNFILHRLEAAGLAPAPPADPVALIRRAYYDLTGLPPTPAEVDAFVTDKSPTAFERLIDRLLDSPHYGERWARHWLDLVRFAETNSFERDGRKPHAWRYRDYVIRSFNDDKPFDQFVREQLAGDELPQVTADTIIATGYYRLGLWDDEPADREQARYDGLDDIVATTGQVFLGLTVNCARCHDHKIDPIPQKDYYSLLAFFHNVTPNGIGGPQVETQIFENEDDRKSAAVRTKELQGKRNQVQAEITSLENTFRSLYENRSSAADELLTQSDLDDLEFRYYRDHWDRLPDFDNIKPETVGRLPDGLFDLAPTTRNTEFGFVYTGTLKVPQDGEYVFSLDSDDGSRLIIDGREVAEYDGIHGTGNPQKVKVTLRQGRVPIRLEYFQRANGWGLIVSWSGPGVPARLLSAAPNKGKVTDLAEAIKTHGEVVLGEERFKNYQSLLETLDKLKKETITSKLALSVTERSSKTPETFVLVRGNAHVRGDKVEPAFPAILGGGSPQLPTPEPAAKTTGRRLALAEWIASPENRLTSRVLVNRLWQHHFGRGIVRSTNNFGQLGDPPTHPELLDYLASEFVAPASGYPGWRMKAMHKLIMMSSAYRMSAKADAAALAKDPTNNLFWRFDMRRLSAEEIRDSIHAVTGKLNPQMYGPGVYPVISKEVLAGQSKPGDGWGKSTPVEQARRSIYIHVKRSLITPLLADFDFCDTDSSCAARFATTQPTQALGMLNGDFLNTQAAEFARRLSREAGSEPREQVKLALRLALSRVPDEASIQRGLEFMKSLENKHGVSRDKSLDYYCLMVLNLNEFVYLD